jgi:hypothetical protein
MSNINNFIDSTGKIKSWPSKHELKFKVLEYIANKFEYNRFYTEKEVNNIIDNYHTFGDYFLIRRGLIESKLLSRTRTGSKYWRIDDNATEEKLMIYKLILENYRIGTILNIVKIKNGVGSICYHVLTDKGELILINIEDNGMNNPHNEYKIHEILESENIPVSKFYSTNNGEYVLYHNENIYHLQSFIKGEIYKPNTSTQWPMDESALMLGKIQKVMEKIPQLPKGMGEGYFKCLSPEKSILSYLETLKIAETKNDKKIKEDIEYRISLLKAIDKIDIQVDRLTCKNTHGDYSTNQIICGQSSINAIIDFTSACVNPICWEVIRSYSIADSKCVDGNINIENLKGYVEKFLTYGQINSYDLKVMAYLYFYQLLFPNYYKQYYLSNNSNKQLLLNNANFSTKLCKWFDLNINSLSDELVRAF